MEELEATSSRIPYEPGKNQEFYGFMKAETVKVQVKFDKSVESYITDRVWSDDQHVDFLKMALLCLPLLFKAYLSSSLLY